MKILITGSHGFVGSNLVNALDEHKLFLWDRKIGKSLKKISKRDLEDIDVVVHLAADISVPNSWQDPVGYFENNAQNTAKLSYLAYIGGVKKFIFASSSSVYADPLSPYGASKLAAEHILDSYKDRMKIHRLRFFNIYGPGQNREFPGVITKLIHASKNRQLFQINGDGEQTRDYTYVKDVVTVIKNLIENDYTLDDPIDIAPGEPVSLKELTKIIKNLSGYLKITYLPEQKEIKHSKAKRPPTTLIKKFTPLEEGLKETYGRID